MHPGCGGQVKQNPETSLPHASERLQQFHREALRGPLAWAWEGPDVKRYEAAFNAMNPWAGKVPAAKVKPPPPQPTPF